MAKLLQQLTFFFPIIFLFCFVLTVFLDDYYYEMKINFHLKFLFFYFAL